MTVDVKSWIKKCEGFREHPYMDTTGHVTIGWGRNLDNGISVDEAELMFDNDFLRTVKELEQFIWYINQPENVQDALINMNFNLGIEKLLEFHQLIHALIDKDYNAAAQACLNSKWAIQVGQRAKDIAVMISETK
jgi:lysozyme